MKGSYTDIRKMFQATQVERLVASGFKEVNISTEVMAIEPEKSCRYYSHNEMIAPLIYKEK